MAQRGAYTTSFVFLPEGTVAIRNSGGAYARGGRPRALGTNQVLEIGPVGGRDGLCLCRERFRLNVLLL